MAEPTLPSTCPNPECGGSGYINNEPCPTCFGTGALPIAGIAPRTLRRLDSIKPANAYHTYQIVEATDTSEYNALSDTWKERYGAILSCGMVDLSEGTKIRIALWTMFGEGTTTRANLEALIND